ncbi:putative ribose-phosphate diphosphokinase [Helianthus anomalus]
MSGYLWIQVSLQVRVQKTKNSNNSNNNSFVAESLAAYGATKVSAYVTHAVFPKNSWKKFVHKNGDGKLPASYVNDESVDYLKKFEQGKVNKILNQYIAFCGQVRIENTHMKNVNMMMLMIKRFELLVTRANGNCEYSEIR